jgi:HAD superfamily hydrolase (TIGR01509 family)
MIKAVAWDIDGTLVDSEPLHLKSLIFVCEKYNVDISDLPDENFIGVNLYGVWKALQKRFPANLEFDDWANQINNFYFANSSALTMTPHASEVLHELHILGVLQAAVSNSNRSVVDINLAALGVTKILNFSLSLEDVKKGKPNPIPYQLAAKKLGVKPYEILAVEDSNSGIISARKAGLMVAAVNIHGCSQTAADFSISSLKEIFNLITTEKLKNNI